MWVGLGAEEEDVRRGSGEEGGRRGLEQVGERKVSGLALASDQLETYLASARQSRKMGIMQVEIRPVVTGEKDLFGERDRSAPFVSEATRSREREAKRT